MQRQSLQSCGSLESSTVNMPLNSPTSIIAVYEALPYWGPELQRQFPQSSVAVRECRSLADLLPSIEGFAKSVLLIDLASGLEACLAWFASSALQRPASCSIIACGSPETAELEWVLRDAGATAFLPDVIPGITLSKLCRRQLGLIQRRVDRSS